MKPDPNFLNRRNLSRATLVAMALAVGGIVLFIVLWIGLGRIGLDNFPRLMLSMCIPPAIIAALIGGYLLLVQPRKKD